MRVSDQDRARPVRDAARSAGGPGHPAAAGSHDGAAARGTRQRRAARPRLRPDRGRGRAQPVRTRATTGSGCTWWAPLASMRTSPRSLISARTIPVASW